MNKKARLENAQEIANEVKAGTFKHAAFDTRASFFPPRKIIQKNQEDIDKLYANRGSGKKTEPVLANHLREVK